MGDTPTALAPFLQVILYGVMAIGWAYAAMWAAAIAAGAYLIGCIPGKPLWLPAKLVLAVTAGVFAIFLAFGSHGHHLAYAGYWAALFCLLGDTYPITAHRKGEGPLLPVWAARTAAAALPIASGLLYRDLIVLVLSLLWSRLILSRTKRKLP